MNAFENELSEALRGERHAIAARMHTDGTVLGTAGLAITVPDTASSTAQPPRQNRRLVGVISLALTAIIGLVMFGYIGGDPNTTVATGAFADEPDEASPAETASAQQPTTEAPPALASGRADDYVTVRLVPRFLAAGLSVPAADEVSALSALSSNSEERYYVRADGTVDLPTVRDHDVFQFAGPMPGTPDCRWTSNPQALVGIIEFAEPGELAEMRADFTPICGLGKRMTFEEPTDEIRVRFEETDEVDLASLSADDFLLAQTTGYELFADVPTLPALVGNRASVYRLDQSSLLVVTVGAPDTDGCAIRGSGLIPAAASRTADTEVVVTFDSGCVATHETPLGPEEIATSCVEATEGASQSSEADDLMKRFCAGEFDLRAGPVYCPKALNSAEGLKMHARPDPASAVQELFGAGDCVLVVGNVGEWSLAQLVRESIPPVRVAGWVMSQELLDSVE